MTFRRMFNYLTNLASLFFTFRRQANRPKLQAANHCRNGLL